MVLIVPQMHPSCCDALTELQGAFDSFAMGNYPYPSSYMGGALPAWPMRAACELLASPRLSSTKLLNVRMSRPCFPGTLHIVHQRPSGARSLTSLIGKFQLAWWFLKLGDVERLQAKS